MGTPTTKESPLFILKKFLSIAIITCCGSTSLAKGNDLGIININGDETPDIVTQLLWPKMHPHLKKGSHNYCHSEMSDYPKKFYKDFVDRNLNESASGEFFIRFYIYKCFWNNKTCDEKDSFDKNNRIKFDVHYDFDC
tara:strand:+ start:11907 stop:12320 length:414 start_codon:yes stop_codon:yes gene_type:complete